MRLYAIYSSILIAVFFSTSTLLFAQNEKIKDTLALPEQESSFSKDDLNKMLKFSKAISRLELGGYGEVAMTRNFYSDNINRYSHAENYKDAKSHGRFDIPHVTFFVGYDFGKGWRMNAEMNMVELKRLSNSKPKRQVNMKLR